MVKIMTLVADEKEKLRV